MRLRLEPLVLLLGLLGIVGCAAPPTGFEKRTLDGVPYSRVFDETEMAVGRYFEPCYCDRENGIISTKYSSEKSMDGIVKLRSIAVIEPDKGGRSTTVFLKIVRERFLEKWEFDHDLTTEIKFDGFDRRLANVILDEIQARAAP